MAIVDSYSESNQSADVGIHGDSYTAVSQSFTGDGSDLESAIFYLKKFGSPTGSVVATLYAHSGTFGTSSVATGAALATSGNLDISSLTTSFALKTLTFGTPYTLVNGTKYVIVITYALGNWDNHLLGGLDNSSPSHAGNYAYNDGSWNADNGKDLCFYINGAVASTSKNLALLGVGD